MEVPPILSYEKTMNSCPTELCGEKKRVEIPKREHLLGDYTVEQLDKYQSRWEIID